MYIQIKPVQLVFHIENVKIEFLLSFDRPVPKYIDIWFSHSKIINPKRERNLEGTDKSKLRRAVMNATASRFPTNPQPNTPHLILVEVGMTATKDHSFSTLNSEQPSQKVTLANAVISCIVESQFLHHGVFTWA
jgi:hypothetical protein